MKPGFCWKDRGSNSNYMVVSEVETNTMHMGSLDIGESYHDKIM